MKKNRKEVADILPQIYEYIDGVLKKSTEKIIEAFNKKQIEINYCDGDFLDAIQAANFLKLKVNTIYSKVSKREIPFYKSGEKGRKLLFAFKDLENYVSKSKIKSQQEIENEALTFLNSKKS